MEPASVQKRLDRDELSPVLIAIAAPALISLVVSLLHTLNSLSVLSNPASILESDPELSRNLVVG